MRRPVILAVFLAAVFPSPGFSQVRVGAEFRVNSYTTANQRISSVASDAAGNFVIVWQSDFQDGSFDGVFAQRYNASGAPVGAEFQVNTFAGSFQSEPVVASGLGGSFMVVWYGYGMGGSGEDVFARRYDAFGTPLGSDFRVNSHSTSRQQEPAVATSASANFVVTWQSYGQDGLNLGVFVQRFNSSGGTIGGEFRANSFTTNDQYNAAVASDAAGNFLVVWQGAGVGGNAEVFGQFFNASGVRRGSEFRVNTYTTYSQRSPAVASDPAGNFMVVWESYTQDGPDFSWGLFGQRYLPSGAPRGGEFQVNTYTSGHQRFAAIAADANGAFTVVWMTDNVFQGQGEIVGRRYDSTGQGGPEFRVNTYTSDVQWTPTLAMDAGGNFVVSWTSDYQDGHQYGVFGQRFSVDLIFADGFE
jgi:hypothetical protein